MTRDAEQLGIEYNIGNAHLLKTGMMEKEICNQILESNSLLEMRAAATQSSNYIVTIVL